jgi:peptidoglycan/LPS O-acetylase OafA/YrhL
MRSNILPRAGNAEYATPESRVIYPALDGLRAIAFLLVFLQHYYFFPWGWTGVNIFFVLSGFLITGILFDTRSDRHRVRNFYIRRTLRIFPLYYGVLIITFLVDPLFHWNWSAAWIAWPLYLGNFLRYVSPTVVMRNSPAQLAAFAWLRPRQAPQLTFFYGHFWSLCVEEQFYFFWPWAIFWIRSRRALIWICSIVVVLVPVARALTQPVAPSWMLTAQLLDSATPFQLDSLLLGALVALLLRGSHQRRVFEAGKIAAIFCGLTAGFLLLAGIAISYPNWRYGYPYPLWKLTWGQTLFDLLAAGIILCVLQPSGLLYRLLSLRPLRWIGRMSYGAYVFHDIPHELYIWFVNAIGRQCQFVAQNSDFFVILVGLTSTLLISWLSFRFYESVFLNLKEYWTIREPRDTTISPG